ncbi:barstar family protein [Streptomyces marokkonensis]|uniref:Barstar family protein n=1 Tax=Streptomyces marokkonensis TaxID=324855 RepID=A0ABW6QEF4_9ACTN|nr:barstar family protein [Streptomyces marokkonensis]
MTDETSGAELTDVPHALVIDLTEVRNAEELHRLLQRDLRFPDFYGRNWDALWDAVTGLVDLPHELTFTGWAAFSAALPAEARTLRGLFDDYLRASGQYLAVPRRIHYR